MKGAVTSWRRGAVGLLAVVLVGAGLGGCAGQGRIDQLEDLNRSLEARNLELQQNIAAAETQTDILRRELETERAEREALTRTVTDLQARLGLSAEQLARLQGELGRVTLLDPTTDAALRELAARYPDLITYDSTSGLLRFTSDLTFDSGSDTVKEGARQALGALAQILTGAGATYELDIVGHTDSQRISAGTAQRHPTNMHLSCHRAISVRRELANLGVHPDRMRASGWGEYRPLVPNAPNGNTPQNRRVEIYITAATSAGTDAGAAAAPVREEPPTRQLEPTK